MDILKLKSEIEKFQAMTGEDGLLGPGGEEQAEETNFVTDEHAGGAGQAPQTKKSWKQELNDSKTAIPLSIGLAITAGLVYDGVRIGGMREKLSLLNLGRRWLCLWEPEQLGGELAESQEGM